MKKLSSLIVFIFLFGVFTIVSAQNGEPPPGGQGFGPQPPRPNLLQELGLTKEQFQQLRRLNNELKPQMQSAQRSLKQANDELDAAIYADETNEEIIQQRIRVVQQAQSEVIRHRVLMETSIRKVLTKDQLFKFRQLRENFQKRQGNPNQRMEKPNKETNPRNQLLKRRLGRPNQPPAI